MPSPINFDFSGLVAGAVANASDIEDAFAAINTYLNAGIPTTDLAKPKNLVSVTFNFESVAVGSEIRGFKAPASTELVHVETIIYKYSSGSSGTGLLAVTIHDSYAEAAADSDAKVTGLSIADDAALGTMDTNTSSTHSFAAGSTIFIRVEATTNTVLNTSVTMWFRTEHVA